MSAPPEGSETNRKQLKNILYNNFTEYLNALDVEHIPVYEEDDGNYDIIKYTIIPKGTRFRFRSRKELHWLDNRPIWADYSESTGSLSFLNQERNAAIGMQHYFGAWVNTIELRKDMTILHMPINYSRVTAPLLNRNNTTKRIRRNTSTKRNRRSLNVTADMEMMVRSLCIPSWRKRSIYKDSLNKYNATICRDGYTMDFLYHLTDRPNSKFHGLRERLLSTMEGRREICLINVTPKTVKLIGSVYAPIE